MIVDETKKQQHNKNSRNGKRGSKREGKKTEWSIHENGSFITLFYEFCLMGFMMFCFAFHKDVTVQRKLKRRTHRLRNLML